jgi:putative peptidoglycan lipid II flippase
LPTLSEHISRNDEEKFKKELFKNIKFLFLLCVPAAVGLWMTSSLAISVLFQRGAFSAEQAAIVAQIVKVYAFTLLGASLTRVLGQAFYAEKSTMVPALASLVGFLFHIVAAPLLMDKYQIEGLVISTSLATFINCFVLIGWFYLRHGSLYFFELTLFLLKVGLASTVVVGVVWVQNEFFEPVSFIEKLLALSGVVLWSAALFFIFAKVLRVEEADLLLQKIVRRRKV